MRPIEFAEQIVRFVSNYDEVAVLRTEKLLLDRMVDKRQQPIEIAGHVEDAVRLPVETELTPRPDLEELLETAQTAGQEHERVGKRGHLLLALVHRVHHT